MHIDLNVIFILESWYLKNSNANYNFFPDLIRLNFWNGSLRFLVSFGWDPSLYSVFYKLDLISMVIGVFWWDLIHLVFSV